MQLFLYRKSKKGLLGSSRDASVPDFRFRRSEKMPSSNFLEFFTGRPKAWKRNERHRTISVPEIWKRLFHSTQDTYSPVGKRNRLMYWSGCQSTGADIKKYLTTAAFVSCTKRNKGTPDKLGTLTVVNLLQGDLSVMWERLLRLGAQHESLWFLGSCHGCILRIHHSAARVQIGDERTLWRRAPNHSKCVQRFELIRDKFG